MHARERFTLVEMMIVVAIVLVLAAIAIPKLAEMQLRAKKAEILPNVAGIQDAEIGYHAAFDTYWEEAAAWPPGGPGKSLRAWVTGTGFDVIGWRPDGAVRGTYQVPLPPNFYSFLTVLGCSAGLSNSCTATEAYCAFGVSDADGDCRQAPAMGTAIAGAAWLPGYETWY